MENLPAELTIDILSKLLVKTIIHCKYVCKKWRNLVLDSSFVNLHLTRSSTDIIILHNTHIDMDTYCHLFDDDPRTLTWVEIKDKVDLHHLHHDAPLMSLDHNLVPIFQNCLIDQIGSVNGLICLWKYDLGDNTFICNPVTRELMVLPRPQSYRQKSCSVVYGFGVNSLTGEYKVVRTFLRNGFRSSQPEVAEAEVYTLGTSEWRSLGQVSYMFNIFGMRYGPILNNHFHWSLYDHDNASEKICTFDLNSEMFQLFPSPPSGKGILHSLTVLKGCLCKFEEAFGSVTIWMMKEYGIKESWHKEVRITQDFRQKFVNPMSLIENDGSILLVINGKLWAFNPRSKTIEDTKIEIPGFSVSGMAYRPSFLKLQNLESERVHMF